MSRSYSHIQQYEKEILELHDKGLTQKEIDERLGLCPHNKNHPIVGGSLFCKNYFYSSAYANVTVY